MNDALRDKFQKMFGTSYAIERQLGGGGMSRVFVADGVALGQMVVAILRCVEALPASTGGDFDFAPAISSPRFDTVRGCAQFATAVCRFNLDLTQVAARDGGRSQ